MSTSNAKRPSNLRFQQGAGSQVIQSNNIRINQLQIDTEPFFEEEFNPQEYLETLLEGEQWNNLKSFYTLLQETSEKSSLNLQSHVYRNYKEFVNISKEISQLETGMFELRDLINELQSIGNSLSNNSIGLTCNDGNDIYLLINLCKINNKLGPKKNNNGQAEGDNTNGGQESLDETNRKELAKLWKAVQGAQDYLPYIEDRRPLLESPGWKELDHSNFRFKRNAHFFLLTDSLLVATRAKRQTIIDIKAGSGTKMGLMARCCVKFSDMTLGDIKDSNEVKDAFKIIQKNEIYVFCARNKEEKKKFLRGVARATADYFRQMHQKALLETSKKVGESLELADTKTINSLIKTGNSNNKSVLTSDFWDSLDIAIAQHSYKEAVDLILEAKQALKSASKTITKNCNDIQDLKQRIQSLTIILEKRARVAQDKSSLKKSISPMIELGLIAEAQQSFFDARHNHIKLRTRQLPLDGSTYQYIASLSKLTFSMICTTCRWHSELFLERSVTSRLISWVRKEIIHFGKLFKSQVFSIPPPSESIIQTCKQVTESNAQILHTVGLDLNFQLNQLLAPDQFGDNEDYGKENTLDYNFGAVMDVA
ncbi:hypothetical protein K502DRAFT_297940 [Neoconidiobolus thromboides FSU 785]|nr:hypothetical protein K502DRAFT_297940 [Neoconidiobolus thromboides FSU 785]